MQGRGWRRYSDRCADVRVEEVRMVKVGKEKRGGMAVVKLREEDKRKLMGKKRGLKGGNIWIEDDLTWEERRAR